MNEEEKARADIVALCRRVYDKGWVANHDGNLSVRVGEDRVVATPTSVCKGDVQPEHLIVVDLAGNKLEGTRKGFSEFSLHLEIYRARPDVRAVLHAHPVTATGFAVAGIPLDPTFMPEAVVSLGDRIPTASFALPYGEEGAAPLREHVNDVDVMLLANHGVIGYGPDLWTAYYRVELVEHLAKIQMVARQLGQVNQLSQDQIRVLLYKRHKAGLGPEARRGAVPTPSKTAPVQDSAINLPAGAAPSAWMGGDNSEAAANAPFRRPEDDPLPPPPEVPSSAELQELLRREVQRVLGK